jgi:hypothetical protein
MTTSHTDKWLIEGNTAYTLMHHGWKKGVETFQNRLYFTVHANKDCPKYESEKAVTHIVRCINAHDDLVEALQNMLDLRDAVMRSECLPDRPEVDIIRAARAALSKATK